MKRSISSFLS